MTDSVPLLVFSDLDGTLLDHDTYRWDAAQSALDALRGIGAGLILASSKTAAEMTVLQAALGLTDWPAIVENGAGLLGDAGADDYDRIRAALQNAPGRDHYTGFGDLSVKEVANLTGLPPEDAARAKTRRFSEPGLWVGPEKVKTAFMDHLKTAGITAREGGRFLTLSFGKTKADQMAAIIARYDPRNTIALGDAPNDVEMIETADYGVIVDNPHRAPLPPLDGEKTGRITRTTDPGPIGWNAAILDLLRHLGFFESTLSHG